MCIPHLRFEVNFHMFKGALEAPKPVFSVLSVNRRRNGLWVNKAYRQLPASLEAFARGCGLYTTEPEI